MRTGLSPIPLTTSIPILALIAGLSTADAAETWRCKLHPTDDPSEKVVVNFDIRGAHVLRSPDDYSGFRERYEVTTSTKEVIVGVTRDGTMGLKIDRRRARGVMSGGALWDGRWFENWIGPCSKIR